MHYVIQKKDKFYVAKNASEANLYMLKNADKADTEYITCYKSPLLNALIAGFGITAINYKEAAEVLKHCGREGFGIDVQKYIRHLRKRDEDR